MGLRGSYTNITHIRELVSISTYILFTIIRIIRKKIYAHKVTQLVTSCNKDSHDKEDIRSIHVQVPLKKIQRTRKKKEWKIDREEALSN